MSVLTDRILKIQENMSTHQSNLDRLKGIMENYEENLKTRFNVSSLKEALTLSESIDKKLNALDKELVKDVAEFERKYPQLSR